MLIVLFMLSYKAGCLYQCGGFGFNSNLKFIHIITYIVLYLIDSFLENLNAESRIEK